MKPFETYPDDRMIVLPKMTGANCRHEYGLKLQQLTKQNKCAYCGIDLTSDYYKWLLLSFYHLIQVNECKRLGIKETWAQSYSNLVLCCLGCNSFSNRYQIQKYQRLPEWTLQAFFNLRDAVFIERKKIIDNKRVTEMEFFSGRPWEQLPRRSDEL
jgi:hypothetical protein